MEELGGYPFRPAWWLRNRHAQTVFGALLRRPPRIRRTRETWETPDGDAVRLHFAPDPDVRAPFLLILHGLEGSADSNYAPGLQGLFGRAGWGSAVLEFRSCGGVMNKTPRLYHSGATEDLAFAVDRLQRRFPTRPLYVAGMSLGGNVLLKWLGEAPEAVPAAVRGAAAICPPFDLTVAGPHIDRAWGGLYARWFLRSLIPKAIEKERQFPGCLDAERVRACRSFMAFDNHATAPLHGFRDVHDYWSRASCGQYLPGIRVPTLLVASADDPFNPASTLPKAAVRDSAYLHPLFTTHGGHGGFVHGPAPWRPRYWAEEQTLRFCQACEALRRDSGVPLPARDPYSSSP